MKRIIELEEAPFVQHFENGIGETVYRVRGFNNIVFDNNSLGKLTPYTEPDSEAIRSEAYAEGRRTMLEETAEKVVAYRKEAYQRGYDDAKHECQDCQKIMMDAEQERVDKAYQQGLEDARNRKATCEFCEYAGNDESDEPCVRCCCGYMNMFRPKGVVPKADSRIRKKIEGIMESLDCTISDFEKAIEEIKNEAD